MRSFKTIAALFFTASVVFCACGSAGSGSSESSGGACADIFITGRECGPCMMARCCPEATACHALDNCVGCYLQGETFDRPPCGPTLQQTSALALCVNKNCMTECTPERFCAGGANASDGGGCVDMEPQGAVTIAECQGAFKTVIRGTLDGKPFDQTYLGPAADFQQVHQPGTLTIVLPGINGGKVDLLYRDACIFSGSGPVPVEGTAQVLDAGPIRTLAPCSLLWTEGNSFGFHLLLANGDQLTGCSN